MSGEMGWFAEVVVLMAKVTSAGPGSPGVTRQALSTLPASTRVTAAANRRKVTFDFMADAPRTRSRRGPYDLFGRTRRGLERWWAVQTPASAASSSRSWRLRILPAALRGSCPSTKMMCVGILNGASRPVRCAVRSSAVSVRPGGGHRGGHLLAEPLVGHAEHGRLVHVGVLVDGGLDLGAVHVLAAAQDHVLDPVLDVDEALVVEAAEVAGAQPAVDDRLGGGLGPVPVAADEVAGP